MVNLQTKFKCCWYFQELLEKAEENSSGEEQWDINFRKYENIDRQDSSGKKKKKRVSESNKKGRTKFCWYEYQICLTDVIYLPGGSLSNLSCLSDTEGSKSGGGARNKKTRSSVSSRSREGGSLPPTKFENVMLYEPPAWDPASQASEPAARPSCWLN